MSEGQFEAKLYALRKSRDGVIVSFVVHPSDVSSDLMNLNIGAHLMIGWAECKEQPGGLASRAASDDSVKSSDVSSPASEPPREKIKRAFSEMSLSQQSGIRASDSRFQDFLEHEYTGVWRNLKDAAASIREICGVQSRSELATDHNAANKWRALNSKFESWLADQLYAESIRR